MYKKIYNLLKNKVDPDKFYSKERLIDEIYIICIYVKYLCDEKKDGFSYDKVNNNKLNDIYLYFSKICNNSLSNEEFDLEKIIRIIKDTSKEELIEDLFKYHDDIGINLINKEAEKICIFCGYDFSSYDRYGNTTYLFYGDHQNGIIFKLLDDLLGIKNKYTFYKKYDLKNNIKYVYINDKLNTKEISQSEYGIKYFKLLVNAISLNKKVILKTDYKKISVLNDFYLERVTNIILNSDYQENNAFLILKNQYGDEDRKINIIIYEKNKNGNANYLQRIIEEDKEVENVLIKVAIKEIKKNNNRIGFKLYQNKNKSLTTKKINDIIDDNKKLVANLTDLDYIIGKEVDKLYNK